MQLQKEVKSSLKIAHLYKKCVAPKKAIMKKRCEIQGDGQEMAVHDGRLRAKILITTIQVNLVPNPSKTWRRQHKFA